MSTVKFFFEFSSPYSYIASLQIDAVAIEAGRSAEWCPIELGVVWQAHGVLDAYRQIRRLKAPYIYRDAARIAKMQGITLAVPATKTPPPNTVLAKLAYWGLYQSDPDHAKLFAQMVWHRYFDEGKPIDSLNDLARATQAIGVDAQTIKAASMQAAARSAQDASNQAAVHSGCFGVPWFIADDDCFFGQDRLPHIAAYLANVK